MNLPNPEAPDADAEERRRKHIESYKKLGKLLLWSGWGVALLSMWLGGRIIDGLHKRIVELETRNRPTAAPQNPAAEQ